MLAAMSLFTNQVPAERPRIDIPGALTATAGMFAIVYGLANAETQSWTDPLTIGMLVAGALLVAGFVAIQRRSPHPLLPLRVVLDRDRGGSFLAMLLSGAGMFAVFLFLTYYMQQTLGFSPIKSGLAFLPMTLAIVISAVSASTKLLPKIGPRPLIGGRHDHRVGGPRDPDRHRRRHVVRRVHAAGHHGHRRGPRPRVQLGDGDGDVRRRAA